MPERPWRCSQCGTINEPVANSCRTCGKWPSLFDLEDTAVEETGVEDDAFEDSVFEPLDEREQVDVYEAPEPVQTYDAPEPVTVEVETFEEPEPAAPRRRFEAPRTQPVFEEGEAEGRRQWVSWLVPLAFVAYLVISYVFSSR
jgi:hypothetical protein